MTNLFLYNYLSEIFIINSPLDQFGEDVDDTFSITDLLDFVVYVIPNLQFIVSLFIFLNMALFSLSENKNYSKSRYFYLSIFIKNEIYDMLTIRFLLIVLVSIVIYFIILYLILILIWFIWFIGFL